MILSVSRRTDIPALYSEWFLNRLRAGEVLVRNPLNPKQVTRIPLDSGRVDCIVFWTKDPRPMLEHLDEIDRMGFQYYFTVTVNPYSRDIEKNVDVKKNIITTFRELSGRIGKKRVIWRYDPILFTPEINSRYHLKWFEYLVNQLGDYTETCVFSFLEQYRKIQTNVETLKIYEPGDSEKRELIGGMSEIARRQSLKLTSCAQTIDFAELGVGKNKCIDDELIGEIIGCKIKAAGDKSQRKECGCVASRDLGTYNTCINGCLYCYANRNKQSAMERHIQYDPLSPMLCDRLRGDEKVSLFRNSGSQKIW